MEASLGMREPDIAKNDLTLTSDHANQESPSNGLGAEHLTNLVAVLTFPTPERQFHCGLVGKSN